MKNFLKFGNHKIGDDTAIFNMCSSRECPSRSLGLCQVINKGHKCYAEKPEIQYGAAVTDYRNNQKDFWKSNDNNAILQHIYRRIKSRRKPTAFLRFNESGDFSGQEDIEKLSYISAGLKTIGVTTYGYTARLDLDYSNINFLVKGSGHNSCPNGSTTVITNETELPEGYILCPGSCKRCNLCKINTQHNIAFLKH